MRSRDVTRIPPPVLIAFVVLLLYPAAQIAALLFYKKRLYATAREWHRLHLRKR
jgi:hypothetical protein